MTGRLLLALRGGGRGPGFRPFGAVFGAADTAFINSETVKGAAYHVVANPWKILYTMECS